MLLRNKFLCDPIFLISVCCRGRAFLRPCRIIFRQNIFKIKNYPKFPEKFPNLIVRVWGFSSYFNDLPENYKNLLIQRALESEISV